MCGIAGIVGSGRAEAVRRMTAALVHRGPDDEGFFDDGIAALGQRRLSIIDLAGGHQPIANERGTLQLVCNGEIYNSPELRRELLARGHRFRTNTDVEVILHLYEEHGTGCAERLRGMFAFALWDAPNRRLLLARDHLGQKPLFYARSGDRFAFASEVKAILASGIVAPAMDLTALWHYVSLRFIPDRLTLFAGIGKLPAAHWALLEGETLTLHRYWSPDFTRKLEGGERQIADRLDETLDTTVRSHLLSDVRVGAFLSGGIDSSLVSAMIARATDGPVPAFSIGVAEQGFNELPWARMVAARYGMEHHEEVVKADLIHLIPSMVHHLDEPADPFGVGVYLVSRLAARHVKVVLGGDGGDESFAGYDRYAGQRLVDWYCVLPAWFRRAVMGRLVRLVPETMAYKSAAKKIRWLHEMSFFSGGERYAQSLSTLRFTHEAKLRLFTPAARARIGDPDSTEKILAHFNAGNATELVDKMLYTDLMTRMPDHLLGIVDRMAMAHSLEVRSPLLDHKLVEFAAAIPAGLKLKGRSLKHILRVVAARHLPAQVVHREKQGFGFPLAIWMRTDLRPFLVNLFARSRLVELGLFDRGSMETILAEHLEGKADHNFRIWILMNLEIWHRIFIEGETVESLKEWIDELSGARR
jgi:asparagine synthase (glutamine-hydrolysing)